MPSSDTRADTNVQSEIPPPAFASNISYRESKGKSGKFILIAVAGLVFLIITAIAAMLAWRLVSAGFESKNGIVENGTNTAENSAVGEDNSSSSNLARRPSKADEEFTRINTELNNGDTRTKKTLIESEVKSAESRYPADYRFVYQAAKLEAVTSKSHHEAFELLFLAGKKAIETGKSDELREDLQKSGSSSLKRLTDHKEWRVLVNALQKNDAKAFEINGH